MITQSAEAAEEAILAQLESAAEIKALDNVLLNGVKSYPSNPFNELEKKEQETLLTNVDAVILQLQKLTKKTQKRFKETKVEKDNLGFLS